MNHILNTSEQTVFKLVFSSTRYLKRFHFSEGLIKVIRTSVIFLIPVAFLSSVPPMVTGCIKQTEKEIRLCGNFKTGRRLKREIFC